LYATITIKPDTGVTAAITGSSASALIVLNGADFVTIDGSNAGTSSRDLTITNTNSGTASAVVWMQTAAGEDGATNNTIKNVNLVGNSNTTTLFGVGSGNSTISLSSGDGGTTTQHNSEQQYQQGAIWDLFPGSERREQKHRECDFAEPDEYRLAKQRGQRRHHGWL
jgi:hypothetical protein